MSVKGSAISGSMPASLLDSQFAGLEPPEEAIRVNIEKPVEALVAEIRAALGRG